MKVSIAFLNCGKTLNWGDIASTLHTAVGNDPHIVGVCEVYDNTPLPAIEAALRKKTGKKYLTAMSQVNPGGPRLGILVDTSLGRLQHVGDDEPFRHGKDWRHWLAGRIEFFKPGTTIPSVRHLVIVVNHWTSMMRGRQDTMMHREILAWEVGNWMCSRDMKSPQVLADAGGQAIPVWQQPSIVMGDFNCEPGSPELRSKRKFTLQAMRTEPRLWKLRTLKQDTQALLYDLAWRKLTANPTAAVPGTFAWKNDIHSPEMLDRMLVSQTLWKGPHMAVRLDKDKQAMRIIPAVKECSDHCAIAISVDIKFK